MIDKILRKFGIEKISNIKIKEGFKKHPPRAKKMLDKWVYYSKFGMFSQPIVLNKENYLIDGYTTYIMAKALRKRYMPVKRV